MSISSSFTPFFCPRGQDGDRSEFRQMTEAERAVLVDLEWIENTGFEPLGRHDFFALTDQGKDYADDSDFDMLIGSAIAYFPDVCGAHGLDTSIVPPLGVEQSDAEDAPDTRSGLASVAEVIKALDLLHETGDDLDSDEFTEQEIALLRDLYELV